MGAAQLNVLPGYTQCKQFLVEIDAFSRPVITAHYTSIGDSRNTINVSFDKVDCVEQQLKI